MLHVVLQDSLKEYMRQHHRNAVAIRLENTGYLHESEFISTPRVHFEAPPDIEHFDTYEIDGVKVYVDKHVEAYDDTIVLNEERRLGLNRCQVDGIKLIRRDS